MRSTVFSMRATPHSRLASYVMAAIVLLVVLSGALDASRPALHILLPCVALLLGWLSWELYQGVRRFWTTDRSIERSYDPWVGLGLAMLGALAILLRFSGGLSSPFYPLFYLAIAFLASFGTASQGSSWFGYALMLELAAVLASGVQNPQVVGRGALHLVFLGVFAGSHHLFLHGMLWSVRRGRNQKSPEAEALASRVSRPPSFVLEPSEFSQISVRALEQECQTLLFLLKEGLDAYGCTFLWVDPERQQYEVVGIESDAPEIETGPFSTRTGAPAGLFKSQTTLRLSRSGDTSIHLPYYGRGIVVRSLLAVPISDGQRVRGALCADRVHPAPFSAREQALLEAAAVVFGRAIQSEHSFRRSSRDLEQLSMLHELGQRLNQASHEAALAQETLEAVACFASYSWGFVSRFDENTQTHTVLATKGDVSFLKGESLSVEGSLLALALKHGCPLPESGLLRSAGPFIAAEDPEGLPAMNSLYLLPLMIKGEAIGCVVMASEDPEAFCDVETEKNMGALINQVAALLENVNSYRRLENLAQRDGLTGLYNHRTMMERLQEMFLAAERYERPLSVVMIDIDYFKMVNDRYGHPTGDRILRSVADVLQGSVRAIDVVARYGGEEFALILEETPLDGALKMADRIRREVSRLEFRNEGDETEIFSITISLGVATFPTHADAHAALIQAADEALYEAKRRGRNQAVPYIMENSQLTILEPDAQAAFIPPQGGWGWGSLPPAHEAEPEAENEQIPWTAWAGASAEWEAVPAVDSAEHHTPAEAQAIDSQEPQTPHHPSAPVHKAPRAQPVHDSVPGD